MKKKTPERKDGHVDPDSLTAGDLALLDQNWSAANQALRFFVDEVRAHRGEGCERWFCLSEDAMSLLVYLKPHQMQIMLQAAVERIIRAE